MFGITNHTKVFIRTGTTDGRLGWEGLKAITVKAIREDPMCGHLFVFCNGARNRIKILWWDGTGFYIAAKRMRRGGFDFPKNEGAVSKMSLQQLDLLLKGVDFTRAR
jgi:transposase